MCCPNVGATLRQLRDRARRKAVRVALHLTWSLRRLKPAHFGLLLCSMDLAHAVAELVVAGGNIDHRRTNCGAG